MQTAWRDTLQRELGAAYQIRQELGGGGMSATYVAEETALGRSVVLKVLSPGLAEGLNAERFRREIQLAARLQHAFVVPLLAAGVADGQPWYTMPLVQGESLRARIAREGALTAAATARILRDVAEALAYAHAHGVVHRDIKPDNILLSGAHALVTDFGVAKALAASTGAAPAMTETGLAIGTVAYMAPEQAAGDPATDHRADLYALGATAYEMLSGRPLFGARTPAQMLVAHAVEQPAPIARVAPGTPPELASLVEQLLAKHPNDRPVRAQDVADALGAMLARWSSGDRAPASRVTFSRAFGLWGAAFAGVVVAAWLAVRWLPVPEWTLPAAVLVMLAGLPVLALTAWLHRPARPLAAVSSVASTTTVGRLEAVVRPHLTWARARRGGMLAIALLVLVVGGWAASRAAGIGPAATLRTQGVVAATDRIFIADFESPPSDTTLGSVVAGLLRQEIERSPSIRLVTDASRRLALRGMEHPVGARVGSSLAQEVSARTNAKVYLTGTVTQIGVDFLLRADLVETRTGVRLGSFKQTARNADDIVVAVDRMGREIRDRLGASLREVRAAPELSWAVTPSLEALRLYTEGNRLANAGDQEAAVRVLERAVQVDTVFAMAYRRLAAYYNNLGQAERAAWAAERAYRHRSKLPSGTRFLVEGTYFTSAAAFDLDRAAAAYESRIELVSPEAAALNNLALVYWEKRDFERSLATYRQALKYDTISAFASVSILSLMWATNRRDEARRHAMVTLPRLFPGRRPVLSARADLAAAELKVDSVVDILDGGLRSLRDSSPSQRAIVLRDLAAAERARGRLTAALRHSAEAARLSRAQPVGGVPSAPLYRASVVGWERRDAREAVRLLDSIAAAHPPGNASALGYPWLELAEAYGRAGDGARGRQLLGAYESRATPSMRAYHTRQLNLARGWTALAEKRYAEAIAAFRAADVTRCLTCAIAPLAHAYDLAGNRDSAIVTYERYLAVPAFGRLATDQVYLAGTYKRLGELYEQRGDWVKARSYYLRFADLWRDADPELQPAVAEVKRRLASPGARKAE